MKVAFLLLGTAKVAFAFPADCPNVTVLHDVVGDNWYDGCLGLDKKTTVTTANACEEQCKADMTCNVWQMTKVHCWSGNAVHGCRSRGSDKALGNFEEDLVAGQRIQHGFVKLVAKNSKVEAIGLKHYPETTGTEAEQIARCKNDCYSDTTCTVWQYGADGCWVEHLPTNAKKETSTESDWAKGMIAGETIEHTCPPYKPEEGLPWPWIITGIILGLLALAALAIIYGLQKKPKVKKTRAVKIEPKKEPIVYFIPQPTVLVPQPSYVMQQPIVQQQYAAPSYTVLR